jgi:hypothetical protein
VIGSAALGGGHEIHLQGEAVILPAHVEVARLAACRKPSCPAPRRPNRSGEDIAHVGILVEAVAAGIGVVGGLGVVAVVAALRAFLALFVDLARVEAAALDGILEQIIGGSGSAWKRSAALGSGLRSG